MKLTVLEGNNIFEENDIPLLYPYYCMSPRAKIETGRRLAIRIEDVGLELEL